MRPTREVVPASERGSWWAERDPEKWKSDAARAAERMALEDSKKVGRGMTIGWAVSGRKL